MLQAWKEYWWLDMEMGLGRGWYLGVGILLLDDRRLDMQMGLGRIKLKALSYYVKILRLAYCSSTMGILLQLYYDHAYIYMEYFCWTQ